MNQSQLNGLTEVLQREADQRYQITISAYHQLKLSDGGLKPIQRMLVVSK
ncbi:hypothetical protein HYT55_01710 [Candidatus Woesearchaeota archaeon]|nr:hypothetical protein [Candidatus Woesearchaeota archaeon]